VHRGSDADLRLLIAYGAESAWLSFQQGERPRGQRPSAAMGSCGCSAGGCVLLLAAALCVCARCIRSLRG
jgi:hypothetical protein